MKARAESILYGWHPRSEIDEDPLALQFETIQLICLNLSEYLKLTEMIPRPLEQLVGDEHQWPDKLVADLKLRSIFDGLVAPRSSHLSDIDFLTNLEDNQVIDRLAEYSLVNASPSESDKSGVCSSYILSADQERWEETLKAFQPMTEEKRYRWRRFLQQTKNP